MSTTQNPSAQDILEKVRNRKHIPKLQGMIGECDEDGMTVCSLEHNDVGDYGEFYDAGLGREVVFRANHFPEIATAYEKLYTDASLMFEALEKAEYECAMGRGEFMALNIEGGLQRLDNALNKLKFTRLKVQQYPPIQ